MLDAFVCLSKQHDTRHPKVPPTANPHCYLTDMKIFAPLALILTILVPSNGKPCASHDDCEGGSLCEIGRCTNPFAKGCLKAFAARKNTDASRSDYRVCNSDDASTGDTSNCIMPLFPYKEVRIASGNWESSMLVSDATKKIVSICSKLRAKSMP